MIAIGDDELHLWFWPGSDPQILAAAGAAGRLLDELEIDRSSRFLRAADARRYEAGRVLLRTILGYYVGLAPCRLRLGTEGNNKPVLLGPQANRPSFNLSHCGSSMILAVTKSGRIGVDVEGPTTPELAGAIARRFFTPREAADVISRSGAERVQRFQSYWTLKEAYGKATGIGLRDGLSSWGFVVPEATGRIRVTGAERPVDAKWRFRQLWLSNGLRAAAAWDACVGRLRLRCLRVVLETQDCRRPAGSKDDLNFVTRGFRPKVVSN